jgi:hypothetical protein
MTEKEKLTKIVLEQLPDISFSLDHAIKAWWVNLLKNGGLRLSDAGDLAFRKAEFEYFDFDFFMPNSVNVSWNQYMLDLNKKMTCPYYINVKSDENKKMPFIRIYDSRIAMLINLYGGVDRYIQSVKVRNR